MTGLAVKEKRHRLLRAACVLVLLFGAPGAASVWAQAAETALREVPREELYAAMLREKNKGYSLEATSNGGRFEANMILQLVRWAEARDPEKSPLLIRHEHYYWAFLKLMGLEPHQAPVLARWWPDTPWQTEDQHPVISSGM